MISSNESRNCHRTVTHVRSVTIAYVDSRENGRRGEIETRRASGGDRLKTGEKVTRQELLSKLIDTVVDSRSEFIGSFRDATPKLTEGEIEQFNEGRIAPGVETDEDDIDEILHG